MSKSKSLVKRFRTKIGLICLLMTLSGWHALPLAAQEANPTRDVSEISADEVNTVAREIWCPLCSGVRLDSCELSACDQMKEVIAIKLAAGEESDGIRDYFVEQYGPQVLGEPPRQGFSWLAWIVPFAALAAGGLFLFRRSRRMVVADGPGSDGPGEGRLDDETSYQQQLEEELERYR